MGIFDAERDRARLDAMEEVSGRAATWFWTRHPVLFCRWLRYVRSCNP